mmetsp:Transcript_13012/g.39300  ORF Transcript_13012/g.39300 Transcript_13012/m.39300 type:complete len:214 (-) Transcript_13012:82-723(-)
MPHFFRLKAEKKRYSLHARSTGSRCKKTTPEGLRSRSTTRSRSVRPIVDVPQYVMLGVASRVIEATVEDRASRAPTLRTYASHVSSFSSQARLFSFSPATIPGCFASIVQTAVVADLWAPATRIRGQHARSVSLFPHDTSPQLGVSCRTWISTRPRPSRCTDRRSTHVDVVSPPNSGTGTSSRGSAQCRRARNNAHTSTNRRLIVGGKHGGRD